MRENEAVVLVSGFYLFIAAMRAWDQFCCVKWDFVSVLKGKHVLTMAAPWIPVKVVDLYIRKFLWFVLSHNNHWSQEDASEYTFTLWFKELNSHQEK